MNDESSWGQRQKRLEEIRNTMKPGFEIAAPQYAPAAPPAPRSTQETIKATLREGLTASIAGGFKFKEPYNNSDYDVTKDMRPQDFAYSAQYALSNSTETTQELQAYQDRMQSNQQAMAARPWLSFFASMADPISLGIDLSTYGLAHAVTLPLLARSISSTQSGARLLSKIATKPKTLAGGLEAVKGAQAGALSTGTQESIKSITDDTYVAEDLGQHILFGSLIGTALGGTVGRIGKKRTQEITDEFIKANKLSLEMAHSPLKVEPIESIESPKFNIRAQLKEEAKPVEPKVEINVDAMLHEAREGGEPIRAAEYAKLRAQFTQIGENLDLPQPVKAALSLVTWPIRNMSATNKLINSNSGSARLYASALARNATEFIGTRNDLVLVRNAQNRIEEFFNQAVYTNLKIYEEFLAANNIEKGKFAAEQLMLSQRVIDEKDFFESVSEQMLYVGKPQTRNVNPHIQKAAEIAYHEVYKPLGDLMKELGILNPEMSQEEVINYLNRHWNTEKLLADPEGFKSWLAEYYEEINQKLSSIMPQYDAMIDDARKLNTIANRFEKAAEKIESLQPKVEQKFNESIEQVAREEQEKLNSIQEEFNEKRDKVSTKYQNAKPESAQKDAKVVKDKLKNEINETIKERDKIESVFQKNIDAVNEKISSLRKDFALKKQSILAGESDAKIKQLVIEADVEHIAKSLNYDESLTEQILFDATQNAEEIGEEAYRILRKDMVAQERLKLIDKLDDLKIERAILKEQRKEYKDINKQFLDEKLKKAKESLEKISAKKSDKETSKLLNTLEKADLQTIDLQEAKITALNKKIFNDKKLKIMEPMIKLENLMKKYSYEGFEAYATRKEQEQIAKRIKSFGASDADIKKMVNDAKKLERKKLKEIEPKNEAREIAEELKVKGEEARKRAEELIPHELRSNKTGRPYKVWDKETDPNYALNLAEKTFYTMIGQEDDIVLNPVMTAISPGQPSMLKARSLKMPDNYPGIERWAERDIRFLIENFTRGVGPVIALTQVMKDLNKLPIIQQTVKRMQVLNPRIGPKKAAELPSEMLNYQEIPKVFATMAREEYRINSKGLSGKELQKATEDYQKVEKNLDTLWKQIRGVFGNDYNVNSSKAADVVDLANSWASTVTLNNLTISMMSELITPSIRYGFDKYLEKSLIPLFNDSQLTSMHVNELKKMGFAIKTGVGSVIRNRITGRNNSFKNTGIGKFITNLSNRIGNITLANQLSDMHEIINGVLIKSALLENAEKAFLNTLEAKDYTHAAQRALSKQDLIDIYNLWKKYGWEKDFTRGIDIGDVDRLSPQDAATFKKYQGFINDEMKTILAKPGVGSSPDFSYHWAGNSVMFLKKWFLASMNDTFIPAAQRADSEAAQGFLSLIALGALQSRIRQLYRGEEPKEFNTEGFIFDAISNSGVLGVYTFGLDAAMTAGIIAGLGGARYDPMNGLPSLIFGPGIIGQSDKALAIMGKMRKILTDEDKQFTYKDFNYMTNSALPLAKWAPISAVLKPKVKEHFESIGRGE